MFVFFVKTIEIFLVRGKPIEFRRLASLIAQTIIMIPRKALFIPHPIGTPLYYSLSNKIILPKYLITQFTAIRLFIIIN